MLLVYWENDHEVSKYESLDDFMRGRTSYNTVRIATDLRIEGSDIKATHYYADELQQLMLDNDTYWRS